MTFYKCYSASSLDSIFQYKGMVFLYNPDFSNNNIYQKLSTRFNIPIDSITGLYTEDLDPYNVLHFALRYDIYFICDRVESTRKFLRKKIDRLEFSNKELNSNYSNLQSQYNDLINRDNAKQQQINQLNGEIMRQNKIREEKEKNFKNMKDAFEKSKKFIEEKNVEESQTFIIKFITNKFLKLFEIEKEKESDLKTSLTAYMKTFTEEYMQYSQLFLQSFKIHSQNIIKGYNVKENNIIEHINFIVLGKAGVGKSAFINESLLLTGNKRAREGKGKSVTDKSVLYSSEKLKMIRMWDTRGLDYKTTQEYILNEVKRLVEDGLKQGPDHYINIILYCTLGDRFQDEDGQLIYEIMKLYPSDNLPVIITQLQAYFENRSKEMEKVIRDILDNYLDHKIVKKIEIASIVSRDFQDKNIFCKARGIPELLRLSFDIMGRAISSATCKKLSQDIENLCKAYVDEKNKYIHNLLKYEMEMMDYYKSFYEETEEENYFDTKKKKPKNELSELNIYRKIQNENYFVVNFINIMKNKFIHIFNNLNNENISLTGINNQKNNNQENNQKEDKPLILLFIKDRLKNMEKKIDDASNKSFEKIFKIRFQNYLSDLQREQSLKNKEFGDNSQIIDVVGIENDFKNKLFIFFKNEFFKIFLCIILKLFMKNLNQILTMNYKKELKENEIIQKIISQKAEDSLKNITQKLKQNLIIELDNCMKEKEQNLKNKKKNDFDNIEVDFNF